MSEFSDLQVHQELSLLRARDVLASLHHPEEQKPSSITCDFMLCKHQAEFTLETQNPLLGVAVTCYQSIAVKHSFPVLQSQVGAWMIKCKSGLMAHCHCLYLIEQNQTREQITSDFVFLKIFSPFWNMFPIRSILLVAEFSKT